MAGAAEHFRGAVRDVVMERLTRPKYDDAVAVALEILDARLAAFEAKIKPGQKPTQKDSQIIDLLKEVKAELQVAFEERWDNRPELGPGPRGG